MSFGDKLKIKVYQQIKTKKSTGQYKMTPREEKIWKYGNDKGWNKQ